MMKNLKIDEGSFRDPDARVVYLNDSVYRVVYPSGFKNSTLKSRPRVLNSSFVKDIYNLDSS